MAKFTVRKGRRYRATIKLTGLKRLASNDTIAGLLARAGFVEIVVEGSGGTRYAKALWPKNDASAEIPPEIVAVEEIETAIAGAARTRRVKRKRKAAAKPRRKPAKTARRKARG
jgi:uncharacterized protein (DUF1800 family)